MKVPIMFGANSHEGSFVYATVYNSFLEPNDYIDNEKFLRNDLVHQLLQTVEIGNSYPVEYMVQDAYFQVPHLEGISVHSVTIQDWQMGNLELMRPGIIDMLGVFFLKVTRIHTSYLSPIPPIYLRRKKLSCGEISDFYA